MQKIKIKNTVIHIFLLIVFAMLFYFFTPRHMDIEKGWIRWVIQYLNMVALFYLNYLFLLPKLFAKRKFAWFGISILIVLALFSLINRFIFITFRPEYDIFMERILGNEDSGHNTLMHMRLSFKPISSYLTALLLSSIIFIIKNNAQREREFLELKSKVNEAELQLLKSQINPHFLFNVLNNVYTLTILKSDKAHKGIERLSEILRYVLYECNEPKIQLGKEIRYIQNYIELMKLKDDGIHNIYFDSSEANANLRIAPLLLIPFVENCFKHGNFEDTKNGFVKIRLHTMDGTFVFEAENTVSTIDKQKDLHGGIGLINVKSRLNSIYKGKYQLECVKKQNLFTVKLKIDGIKKTH